MKNKEKGWYMLIYYKFRYILSKKEQNEKKNVFEMQNSAIYI